jgi:LacI family transcriptional regulator
LNISTSRGDTARDVASLVRLRDHHVDGLILLTNTVDDGTLARLIGKRRNVVLLDEDIARVNVPKVFVENETGAHRATAHLLAAGHRRIGFLGGPLGLSSAEERYAGYCRALGEAGVAHDAALVARGSFAPDFAQAATLAMLAQTDPPTALFASSDYLALGALRALRHAGASIPDDVSFVSFDDTLIGDMLVPALTAIRQPVEALGRHGFQVLHALINRKSAPRLTRLPVELIERQSVAAPRQGRKL